jgi:hypothetical protein
MFYIIIKLIIFFNILVCFFFEPTCSIVALEITKSEEKLFKHYTPNDVSTKISPLLETNFQEKFNIKLNIFSILGIKSGR